MTLLLMPALSSTRWDALRQTVLSTRPSHISTPSAFCVLSHVLHVGFPLDPFP